MSSSQQPWPFGHRLEGGGAQEQPPVAEGFVRVGVAGCGQRLDQIDLVEVRGPCVGLAAVESPQPAVRHDDPVGGPCVERRHDAGTGVLLGRVGVVEVRAVEPAVPGVDERRRQLAAVAALEEVVGLGLVGLAGPVDRGLEAELLEERFEQLVAQRVLVLAAPASLGVPQEITDEGEHLRRVVPPGRVFSQAVPQEVVGEQAPVLEVFAGVGGGVEDAAELVELLQGVPAGPGEAPQRAQVEPGRAAAVDA